MTPLKSPSQMIGRFTIVKRLGRGAQGAVFLGHDPDLDRRVAIKLVNEIPELQRGDSAVSTQARNLAQLRHPNIVALFESGRFHNFTYLVFEYLEGVTLRDELTRRGALGLAEAYSTMSQVVDAMAYAHAKGVVHLDLNPNNIMRDEGGKPRVMDFDLSRQVQGDNASALIAGTVPYMSPEQFTTRTSDTRTDVFSLGQIFYECLTGHRAVPETTRRRMVEQICHRDPDLVALCTADPGGQFVDIVRRATAKDPTHRFQTAREMHDAMLQAWEAMHGTAEVKAAAVHGTVAFVLKRIERKGDFPALSRTLAEVNQLTRDGSHTPVSRLTHVVLRDFALSSRLLKLANSSYYARGAGRIKTVSDAISLLGVDQVRLTCNGLACFGHFAGRKESHRLREETIGAFIAGLIARHLAMQFASKSSEEAFLAGMLCNLGRMLALFYFPEDFEDLESLRAGGASEAEAARSVLGITLPELGAAVGEVWGLPPVVLASMSHQTARDPDPEDALPLSIARFASRLVGVDATGVGDPLDLLQAARALNAPVGLDVAAVHALLAAAVEKFRLFAPALEVDAGDSTCIRRLDAWLAAVSEALAPTRDDEPAPAIAATAAR